MGYSASAEEGEHYDERSQVEKSRGPVEDVKEPVLPCDHSEHTVLASSCPVSAHPRHVYERERADNDNSFHGLK